MGNTRTVLLLSLLLAGGAAGTFLAFRADPVAERLDPVADPDEMRPSGEPEWAEEFDASPGPGAAVDHPPMDLPSAVEDGTLTEARIRHIRSNILDGGNDLRIAMKQLILLGPKGAPLLPDLEKVIAEGGENDRRTAMVALMAVEGSRRYMRELALGALERPSSEGYLRLADPVAGGALIAAMRLSRFGTEKWILGVEQVAELLCNDPAAAATVLAERLLDAPPGDLPGWIEIIRGYRPPPVELGDALARCLTTAAEPRALAVIEVLGHGETDLGPLTDALLDPLLRRLERPVGNDPAVKKLLLRALGNLDTEDPRVSGRLAIALGGAREERLAAVQALEKLGPRASGAVEALLEEYRTEGGWRAGTLRALLATRSEKAMPVFLEVINTSGRYGTQDIIDVLEGLPDVVGAATALPVLRERYGKYCSGIRAKTAVCAIRIDPALESKHTGTIVVWAIQYGTEATRARGCYAAKQLERLTPQVTDALIHMSERDTRNDRRGAVAAMAALTRHGEAAHVFLPALEALVGDPWVGMHAMSSIAVLDTSGEVFREMLLEMAHSDLPDKRRSAVWLLRHIERPEPGDVALLRSILASEGRRFQKARRYAKELMETPSWLRAAAGL